MRNIVLVAKREYLEQIRGRAFKVTTVLVPGLFALIIFIAYLAGRGSGVGKHVIVAAPRAALADAIRAQVVGDKDARTRVDVVAPATPADRAGHWPRRGPAAQGPGCLLPDQCSGRVCASTTRYGR